jgi:cell division protein FtsW (lipid II flippase)
MSRRTVAGIGGVVVGLILLAVLPWWVSVLIIAAAIAIPVTSYRMLDPSQRRRLREVRGLRRQQLGR